MIFLKKFENSTLDRILDKINLSGMDSLTDYEKEFLNKISKDEPTQDIEKELSSKQFEDEIGTYSAKLFLYDIIPVLNNMNIETHYKWNGKLIVNDIEYDGYILFNDDDYLLCYFENENSDIFTDLEGLEYEIDNFMSLAFYELKSK